MLWKNMDELLEIETRKSEARIRSQRLPEMMSEPIVPTG